MRILQLIDSLETGGAERMAVNYANALASRLEFSGLAVTRKEGSLRQDLSSNCGYIFLSKKKTFDPGAIRRLRQFCKFNAVTIIHAHSTSWFLAVCVKLTLPKIKIIWHDHYGNSEFLATRPALALKVGSVFFDGILSVNEKLANWARRGLSCRNVVYLANFSQPTLYSGSITRLSGKDGKRVLLLANLRPQKNHALLLEAVSRIGDTDWTFHLVGKNFNDEYSETLFKNIRSQNLENRIFTYGAKDDVTNIISQCDIGILTSDSEGLPVALLEYGAQGKAVVVTAVGEIPSVIKNGENGLLVERRDADAMTSALLELMRETELRNRLGERLRQTVIENYSEEGIIEKYLNWVRDL